MSQTASVASNPLSELTLPERYPKARRVLHAVGGPMLLGAFAAGVFAHYSVVDSASHQWAMRLHVLLGLVGTALTVARIVACRRMPGPPPLDMPAWRQKIFKFDHRLLYLSAVLLGISGLAMLLKGGVGAYVMGSTAMPDMGDCVPRTAHGVLIKVFAALFIAHIGGVIGYQLTRGKTLARMGIGG